MDHPLRGVAHRRQGSNRPRAAGAAVLAGPAPEGLIRRRVLRMSSCPRAAAALYLLLRTFSVSAQSCFTWLTLPANMSFSRALSSTSMILSTPLAPSMVGVPTK